VAQGVELTCSDRLESQPTTRHRWARAKTRERHRALPARPSGNGERGKRDSISGSQVGPTLANRRPVLGATDKRRWCTTNGDAASVGRSSRHRLKVTRRDDPKRVVETSIDPLKPERVVPWTPERSRIFLRFQGRHVSKSHVFHPDAVPRQHRMGVRARSKLWTVTKALLG
jgi:hypothetical protein